MKNELEFKSEKLKKYKKALEDIYGGPGSGRTSEGGGGESSERGKELNKLYDEKNKLMRKVRAGGKGASEAAQKVNEIDEKISGLEKKTLPSDPEKVTKKPNIGYPKPIKR